MKILIAGDYCPKDRVAQLIEKGDTADILADIEQIVQQADYAIVNFECPVVGEFAKPISKKGPNLRCDARAVTVLRNAGFKCVTLANNHFRDYGDDGCLTTIGLLDREGIAHVGGGADKKKAQEILYEQIGEKTIAIINFCENEFSIATDNRAGSAPLDLIDNYRQIAAARKKADYVIVIIHGGHELFQLPSPRMKKTYRWFIDSGADVVVNHHQHCYSGYEIYNNKPIFYGLGNFCFDWPKRRNSIWNEGFMLILNLDNAISYNLVPYTQCNEAPKVMRMGVQDRNIFFEKINIFNSVISDDTKLKAAVDLYYSSCKSDCKIMLGNGSDNKIIRALKRKGLLSSKVSAFKRNILSDYIFCESHRDKVEYWLNNDNENCNV